MSVSQFGYLYREQGEWEKVPMHIGFSADQKMNESTILLINDVQKMTSGDNFLQTTNISWDEDEDIAIQIKMYS